MAESYYHDVEPCLKKKIPVVWVNRRKETLEPGQKKPTPRSRTCARPTSSSGARARRRAGRRRPRGRRRRRLGHLRGRRARRCARATRRSLVDSPVLPAELESLPAVLEQAGFPVQGCSSPTATGTTCSAAWPSRGAGRRVARPPPRACAPSPAARSASSAHWTRSTTSSGARRSSLGGVEALPVPGHLEIGDRRRSSSIPPTATRPTAWPSGPRGRACSCAGDYLSPVEIPMISPGRLARRLPGHARAPARRWSSAAEVVVPGHGEPIDGVRAAGDPARGPRLPRRAGARRRGRPLPLARRTGAQRAIHAENVARVAGS